MRGRLKMLTLRRVKLNRINKTYNATSSYTRKCACLPGEGGQGTELRGCLALLRQGPQRSSWKPARAACSQEPRRRCANYSAPSSEPPWGPGSNSPCHQGHDQDNVWAVKGLRSHLNKSRAWRTRELSKSSRVLFNESGSQEQQGSQLTSGFRYRDFPEQTTRILKDSFGQGISRKFLHFQTSILPRASSPDRTTCRMRTIPRPHPSFSSSHCHSMSTAHSLFQHLGSCQLPCGNQSEVHRSRTISLIFSSDSISSVSACWLLEITCQDFPLANPSNILHLYWLNPLSHWFLEKKKM